MNRREAIRTLAAGSAAGALAGGMAVMATPSATVEPISPGLAFAIERHRAALAEMEASGRVQEACECAMHVLETPDTRSAFDAADDAFNLDCEREQAAHNRVIAAPILTMADMRAKAAYLASVARHMIHDGGTMAALLASMGAVEGAPSFRETPEPDPMDAAVSAYLVVLGEQQACEASDDTAGAEVASVRAVGMWQHLQSEPPAIASLAGVAAALRFVLSDTNWLDADHAKMLAPALAYLDGRA